MGMSLDGCEVAAGDAVFDLFFGPGRVRDVTADGHVVVLFGARMFTYDERGVGVHGRRSLFWQDPVVVVPLKDERLWAVQRGVLSALSQGLRLDGGA